MPAHPLREESRQYCRQSPIQVLTHLAVGRSTERDNTWNVAWVVAHQHDVADFDRHIGPSANSNPNVRGGIARHHHHFDVLLVQHSNRLSRLLADGVGDRQGCNWMIITQNRNGGLSSRCRTVNQRLQF